MREYHSVHVNFVSYGPAGLWEKHTQTVFCVDM